MFSRLRGFLGRHRRKFIVGSVVITSVIFLTRYTQRKIREWQEKEIRDMLERTKRRQNFEGAERLCNGMIMSHAPTLRSSIVKILDTESFVNMLRNGCTDKVGTWHELKVMAIARSAVIVYSHTMFATLIRILFNVVAGHMYKNAQNTEGSSLKKATQITYLSLFSYFLYEGVEKLSLLIKQKVGEITASMSLKDEFTLRDLEEIYWAITSSISADSSKDPVKNLPEYMLPSTNKNEGNEEDNAMLIKLTNEALDLLESEEVQNLIQSNIRSGFVLLVDHISEFFTGPPTMKNGTRNGISIPSTSSQKTGSWMANGIESNCHSTFIDINRVSIPMAKLIPIINGQVPDKPTPKDVPTDLLQRLILNNELKTLGANIYEAFSF